MKLMVIGGGGREHAIIKKLKENSAVEVIYALPGNGGIAADATCVNIGATDIDGIVNFAKENAIDFAVVAPDDPLVLGMVDALEERLIEPGLCSKLYRKELFCGLEEKMDLSIRNNEDMLMNYYLFSKANQSVYEDVCPYHYMIRSDSASHRKLSEHRIYDPVRVRELILEHIRTRTNLKVKNLMQLLNKKTRI